jgi:cell division protein FtsQ
VSMDDRVTGQGSPETGRSGIETPIAPTPSTLRVDEDRRRKLRPWAIIGAAAVVLATGGVTLSYTSIFGARVVEVKGEEHLGPRQVLRAAGLGLGSNVVHLDEGGAETRLEMHPWIRDATVETTFPRTIRISVIERSALLVAELDGARSLVAGDGTVLGRAPWSVELPEVIAADGSGSSTQMAASAGAVVRPMPPALRRRVETVLVSSDGSIILIVDGQVEVRYGPVDSASAKARALRAILDFAEGEGRGLVSIDVTAPAAPTARFVGSPIPHSTPDPSADPSNSD